MNWQRWLRWGAGIVLLAVVGLTVLGAARVARPDAFAIAWIEVNGPFERVTAEQVRSAAAPLLADGFFAVEPGRVKHSVEQVPWVHTAEVSKRWPDTVVIEVAEHRPLGRWGEDRLVSEAGQLFQVDGAVAIGGLPVFEGPDESSAKVVDFYRALQARFAGTGLEVRRLSRSPRGAWRAVLNDDIDLLLGSEAPLPRVDRLVVALNEIGGDPGSTLARIDLRYGHGFAVRWRDPEAGAAITVKGTEKP